MHESQFYWIQGDGLRLGCLPSTGSTGRNVNNYAAFQELVCGALFGDADDFEFGACNG